MLEELPSKIPSSGGAAPPASEPKADSPPVIPPNIATRDNLLDMEAMTKTLTGKVTELETVLRDVQQKTNVLFQVKFPFYRLLEEKSFDNFRLKSDTVLTRNN